MQSVDDADCATATVALFILPGMVHRANSCYKSSTPAQASVLRPERPLDLLRRIASAENMPVMIITSAAAIMKAAPVRLVIANRATDETDSALQRLTKQAVKSCREGRRDRQNLISANPASSIPRRLSAAEEQDLVARLFPPATDRDILRVVPDNVEALQLETEEIVRSIRRLKVDKTAGQSYLTNKLLLRLLTQGSEPDQLAIAMALTRVFNRLLSGKMPRSVRPLWLTGRAVFIPKSGGDTLHPLGISETLYRFMGLIVSSKRGPSIGQSLHPIRVGLGIPGGAEIDAVVSDLGCQRNR
jgi:hypothetical protein